MTFDEFGLCCIANKIGKEANKRRYNNNLYHSVDILFVMERLTINLSYIICMYSMYDNIMYVCISIIVHIHTVVT